VFTSVSQVSFLHVSVIPLFVLLCHVCVCVLGPTPDAAHGHRSHAATCLPASDVEPRDSRRDLLCFCVGRRDPHLLNILKIITLSYSASCGLLLGPNLVLP